MKRMPPLHLFQLFFVCGTLFFSLLIGCAASVDDGGSTSGSESSGGDSGGGGGSSSSGTPDAPTPATARAVIANTSTNTIGIVPGEAFAAITMPAGTASTSGATLTYSMTGLSTETGLEFDTSTRELKLSSGNTTIPTNATTKTDLQVTYTVTEGSKSDSETFVINDADGDGINDWKECLFKSRPYVGQHGWTWCGCKNEDFECSDVSSAVLKATEGVAVLTDNTSTDRDSDGTTDKSEVANGTNIFVKGTGGVTFVRSATLNTGIDVRRCVHGDYDLDGDHDICCSNYNNNVGTTVSCFLCNGSGTCGAATNYTVGTGPFGITTGHFNADSNLDLVTANDAGGNISVLLGNGGGAFQAAANTTIGTSPHTVLPGDLDKDGDLDLVVSNEVGNTVSILLNNGSANFTESTLTGLNGPSGLTLGDFDNDKDLDIAVANDAAGASSLTVFLCNGNGTCGTGTSVLVGSRPVNVVHCDCDADGDEDLVAGNYNNGAGTTISVVTNNGSGTFTEARTLTAGNGASVRACADIDGDGDLDVLGKDDADDTVSIFLNQGSCTFASRSTVTVGDMPSGVEMGDFDGDGALDFVVANSNDNTATVHINR